MDGATGIMRYETYRSLLSYGILFLLAFVILLVSVVLYSVNLLMPTQFSNNLDSLVAVSAVASLLAMVLTLRLVMRVLSLEKSDEGEDEYPRSRDEEEILDAIKKDGGRMLQNALVSSSRFSKAKVSRLVSDLENKGLITKRRRGVTNELILEKWK